MKKFIIRPSAPMYEMPAHQLKELLAANITPELPGFTYNGTYIWYAPWKDHCRKVIRVYPLKGCSAVFLWGLCFDFLPVFSSGGYLRYQRTDKSVGLHLFCWPPGHWNPVPKQSVSCRFSRFGRNPKDVKAQVLQAFHEAQGLFVPWFQSCCDLPGALAEARRQCTDPDSRLNRPAPDYVYAFLLAANGDVQAGMEALEMYWKCQLGQDFPVTLYDKLRARLQSCAG